MPVDYGTDYSTTAPVDYGNTANASPEDLREWADHIERDMRRARKAAKRSRKEKERIERRRGVAFDALERIARTGSDAAAVEAAKALLA